MVKGGEDHDSLARIDLTDDQVRAIEEKTGVRLTEIELLAVSGEAARSLSPNLAAGVVVVACW